MEIVKVITHIKNNDNDEELHMRSFLTNDEQRCLCLFRKMSAEDQKIILGRMSGIISKYFEP